jgi:3-hydroxybutyryl-CoA dehydrogenase
MSGGVLQRVAVIGAGTMGHGIAQVCAAAGAAVTVTDVSEAALQRGREGVEGSLGRMVAKGKIDGAARDAVLARVRWTTSLEAAVADVDLAVEAAPERMELKRDLFARIDAAAPATALLGSNTSSLSITEIASVTRRPLAHRGPALLQPGARDGARRGGARRAHVGDAAVDRALAFAAQVGKTPIVVRDVPGFATSRLGRGAGRRGHSHARERRGLGRGHRQGHGARLPPPHGPAALTDLVGLDVRLAILEHLHREVGEQFPPAGAAAADGARGQAREEDGRGLLPLVSGGVA